MSESRIRRRLVPAVVAALALALAGCSRHTSLTVMADLTPFMSTGEKQAVVPYPAGTVDIDLPFSATTANPGERVDLGQLGMPADAASSIDSLSLQFLATLDPTTDIGAGTVTLYVAPASETTDVFVPGYRAAQTDVGALAAGESATVKATFRLVEQRDPQILQYVQSGSFRVGVAIRASAPSSGQAAVVLTHLVVTLSLPPGWGLP